MGSGGARTGSYPSGRDAQIRRRPVGARPPDDRLRWIPNSSTGSATTLRAAGYDTGGVLDAARRAGAPRPRSRREGRRPSGHRRRLAAVHPDPALPARARPPERAVTAALPRTGVGGALALGAIERDGDEVRAALDIRPHAADYDEFLVVSDLDSDVRPGPMRPDHVLGIGTASLTLARATVREPVAQRAGHRRRLRDPGAALARVTPPGSPVPTPTRGRCCWPPRPRGCPASSGNCCPARCSSRSTTRRFDLIVSNPPFVISAGEQRYSYRDSGVAGDGLVRRLVGGLADHLNPGGTAQLLANWIVHEDTDWRERVGSWVHATGLDGWVVQRELADPVEYVALWLADAGENGDEKLAADWLEYFERERVSGLGMGLITLRDNGVPHTDRHAGRADRGPATRSPGRRRRRSWPGSAGWRPPPTPTCWPVGLALADSVLLEQRSLPGPDGWLPVYRLLRRPGGPGAVLQLDEWTQGLLAGCRGELPLQRTAGAVRRRPRLRAGAADRRRAARHPARRRPRPAAPDRRPRSAGAVKAVVSRVSSAAVTVDGEVVGCDRRRTAGAARHHAQ